MNGEIHRETDARIDEALRDLGSATPEPGLEGRVLNRLAAARMDARFSAGAKARPRFSSFAAPLLGFVSAALVCAVIVSSSVRYSHRSHAGNTASPPALVMPGTGVGAASAVRPAAPASAPVPVGPTAHGRSVRHSTQGRARIAPQAHKAPGVAVPSPPASSPQN